MQMLQQVESGGRVNLFNKAADLRVQKEKDNNGEQEFKYIFEPVCEAG
jgi:hypothetical protein